jgi:hypothetical protein
MKANKYSYLKVIQQYYAGSYGWEDVSEYKADSSGIPIEQSDKLSPKGRKESLLAHDLREYRTLGYPTRVIFRRELNTIPVNSTERFLFLSEAQKFQRKMRRQGYSTKLKKFAGIASPYSIVEYSKG